MRNKTLFEKLAAAEKKFFSHDFFSPVLKGKPVRIRLEGIVLTLKIRPNDYEGWGVFKTESQTQARLKREPTVAEKQKYLECFPKVSLVVCRRGEKVVGVPATDGDKRMRITGQVPVSLAEGVQLFDTIDVRYDGAHFWFDRRSTFRPLRLAVQLREALESETEPEEISFAGMSPADRLAYRLAHFHLIDSKRDREEERIKAALERGGAEFKSYVERGGDYVVTFTVKDAAGREHSHSPVIKKDDALNVVTSGICLTDHATGVNHDTDYDLQSLVSVLVEGHNRYAVHRW